jgi:dTDP-4-dehydrorhamnose 3,5-epimerase
MTDSITRPAVQASYDDYMVSDTNPDPKNDGSRSIRFAKSKLPGCYTVQFPAFRDQRGLFVKTIQRSAFEEHGLNADFVEVFYTTSGENVLRGMHFQVPPSGQAKLVYCTSGSICDITLDLRVGSPTYGEYDIHELSAEANNAIYLPAGIAHGFAVRNWPANVMYHVTAEHDPKCDKGILWNSFNAPWPITDPVISARDAAQPSLTGFKSPFVFHPEPAQGKSR